MTRMSQISEWPSVQKLSFFQKSMFGLRMLFLFGAFVKPGLCLSSFVPLHCCCIELASSFDDVFLTFLPTHCQHADAPTFSVGGFGTEATCVIATVSFGKALLHSRP